MKKTKISESNKSEEESPKKISKLINYSFLSDKNNKYEITIQKELNNKISITAFDVYNLKKYADTFSINDFKKYKYLSLLETIEEIFDELIDKIEKNLPKLIEKNNVLQIHIETGHTKFKEINIYLNEKATVFNEDYKELYSIIIKLQEKEKLHDTQIKLLNKDIQELKKNNFELIQKNAILENSIETIKQIINFNNYNYYNSEQETNNISTLSNTIPLSKNYVPYYPKSFKEKNKEIKNSLNINEKPFIPKNLKKNEEEEDEDKK